MSRGLGYRRDIPDSRDHLFAAHPLSSDPIPPSASVDDSRIVVKDQSQSSSCVGQSTSQALRLAYLKRGIECPDLSALFVYRIARNLDGTEGDEGSQLRSGCRAVQSLGCAPEKSWPFNDAKVNDQLSFAAEHDGFDRDGTRKYYRIAAGDTNGVKRAIAAGFPVTVGFDVDEDFVSGDGKSLIDIQDQSRIAGGHALCVVSYDADVFTILNSWGTSYGHNGRFRATEGFLASGSDLWAWELGSTP